MSCAVTLGTREIGIVLALGAVRSEVLWVVLRQILLLVAAGVAVGIPVALAGDRFISSMLFGLRATDAASLVAAVCLLLAVAVIAGYLPARRASLIDPMVALRY